MREFSEYEPVFSRQKIEHQRADIFDRVIGPYSGDMYLTTLNCFPNFVSLKKIKLYTSGRSRQITAGLLDDETPFIFFGMKEGAITPRIKSRFTERFLLPEAGNDMPEEFFRPIAFAHELGHSIQHDQNFGKYFGWIDRRAYSDKKSYAKYVNSDIEANADFIAAEVLGNSQFGIAAGVWPPNEGPADWRDWVKEHPVSKTITRFIA